TGFTMAEILLSLTIIGVVAAITLPSLTGNINERTWNTQRKALFARMSQAIALMPALNGYGTLTEGASSTSAVDTAAETFVTAGLSKVLKINNICDSEHLADCGLPAKINPYSGSALPFPKTMAEMNPAIVSNSATDTIPHTQLDTKAAAFETANGESVAVYYYPNCVSSLMENFNYSMASKLCVNFIYDLNGSKGPNTYGKDIGFISVFYPADSEVVSPYVSNRDVSDGASHTQALSLCKNIDSGEWRMPNKMELVSMYVNKNIIGVSHTWTYWSSTVYDSEQAWDMNFTGGNANVVSKNHSKHVRCVKR
ncbi:MAG: DUF1566 domain-containing protein, partial [Fusobacterium sp.]|nr:DUF1566 domain-containing protein [Fusobacterium sp.]